MLQIKNTLGGGKPEGLYAWKKYNAKPSEIIVQENPSFTVDVVSSSSSSYVTITLNGDNEFLDRIDDSYFDGFTIKPTSTQSRFRYTNGVLYLTTSSTATTSNYKYHYDAKTHIITALQTGNYFDYTGSTSLSYSGTKTFELPILIGNFIDYIVSDKENAYPDGGEKGGYWYEKVVEGLDIDLSKLGCTKFEMGSITPSSNTVNVTVTHSMGIKPKYGIIVREAEASSGYTISKVATMVFEDDYCGAYAFFSGGQKDENYNGTTFNMSISYFSDTKFTFSGSGSYKFFSGFKYNYILLG